MRISLQNHKFTVIVAVSACWLGGCSMPNVSDFVGRAEMPRLPKLDMDLTPFSQKAPPPAATPQQQPRNSGRFERGAPPPNAAAQPQPQQRRFERAAPPAQQAIARPAPAPQPQPQLDC